MGIIFKRKNLICSSCETVGHLAISESNNSENNFFEYSLPNSKKRFFICKNCHTILSLSPILEKIEYYKTIDVEFIKGFDFDIYLPHRLTDNLYNRKNLLGINRIFLFFISNYIFDNNEEDEVEDLRQLQKTFHHVIEHLQYLDDTEKIQRNLHDQVMKSVKSKPVMDFIKRWNYENRLRYCSICESQEHDDDDCPLQY
ncbi:MAG: hypothetical protein QGG38_07975 [Nitrospinaceae bacterium]|jgi:hypothetical protein|nr:hypothetical protein [Nitrospinaceae bacterium]|tara:strand:- start:1798 stop:2394 length:597 start_codon:yes stop_codon:yes gene_type:complete